MARSEDFSTDNSYIKYYIDCVQNSQNIGNNTSNVTVKVYIYRTNTGYETYGNGTCYCKINGTTYSASIGTSQIIKNSPHILIFNKTLDIGHDANGSKKLTMSSWINHSRVNASEHSFYVNLTNIPRTSSFTLSQTNCELGTTEQVVTISRASSSFTHKIIYQLGSISWEGQAYNSGNTTFRFTPTLGDAKQLPNSTTGTATVIVETYSGSSRIGSASRTFGVSVPAKVKPSFSELSVSIVESGASASYGYVQGKSKASLEIKGATGAEGSTVKSYSIVGGGYSSSSTSLVTGVLNTYGDISFKAYVVDSRGRSSDTKEVVIKVNQYFKPKIESSSIYRCREDGVADENGTFIRVLVGYAYASIGGKNSITATVDYKLSVASSYGLTRGQVPLPNGTPIIIGEGNVDTESSYDVLITLKDNFDSISSSTAIASAFVTMDFKKGGKGIAIGKASEVEGLFDIAMNVDIKGNFTVNGKPIQVDTPVTDWQNLPSQIKLKGTDKYLSMGVGGGDCYLTNTKTNSYLQLKDDGTINMSGQLNLSSFNPPTNFAYFNVNTSRDGNGVGDGNTHIGYNSNGIYNHYFRGKGRMNINMLDGLWTNKINASDWIQSKEYWLPPDGKIYSGHNSKYIIGDHANGNVTLSAAGGMLFLGYQNTTAIKVYQSLFDVGAGSGANLRMNANWSGSAGTEISLYNSKGKGWGFIGNSENTFYRVYGAGGSVSQRKNKYDITRIDNSLLYDYVKDVNVYGYRTISTDAETGETIKRSDMCIGCMVDELPLEVVFYDNESGDGKAVDNYGYISMLLGALKEAQDRIEYLEFKMMKMEERIDGIINNG